MTISLAWIRKSKDALELLVASDSRLRSHGAMDEAQKIFLLERGDAFLAFCGDTAVAYPLFLQTATTMNNNGRTGTRALDVIEVAALIGRILNQLVGSWDRHVLILE